MPCLGSGLRGLAATDPVLWFAGEDVSERAYKDVWVPGGRQSIVTTPTTRTQTLTPSSSVVHSLIDLSVSFKSTGSL